MQSTECNTEIQILLKIAMTKKVHFESDAFNKKEGFGRFFVKKALPTLRFFLRIWIFR